jgi:dihydropyrimidine dehydrogenase (NAD+) subunit PreA
VDHTHLPVVAMMTPNITKMTVPAIAAAEGGAHGISAINTMKSIANIDLDNITGKPVVNGKSSISGYSGNAVKPIALRFITELNQCHDLQSVQFSGIGGIERPLCWLPSLP